jgi:hypothetical protein
MSFRSVNCKLSGSFAREPSLLDCEVTEAELDLGLADSASSSEQSKSSLSGSSLYDGEATAFADKPSDVLVAAAEEPLLFWSLDLGLGGDERHSLRLVLTIAGK